MKKLLFLATAFAMATLANAATMKWQSSEITLHDGNTAAKDDVTAYLYTLSSEQYTAWMTDYATDGAGLTLAIMNAYQSAVVRAQKNSNTSGKALLTDPDDYSKGDTAYAAILYKDNNDEDYVMGNIGKYYFDGTDDVTAGDMALTIGGDLVSGTGSTSWQAVPEPFSGSLALLGVGLVALRRKMKKQKKA